MYFLPWKGIMVKGESVNLYYRGSIFTVNAIMVSFYPSVSVLAN